MMISCPERTVFTSPGFCCPNTEKIYHRSLTYTEQTKHLLLDTDERGWKPGEVDQRRIHVPAFI